MVSTLSPPCGPLRVGESLSRRLMLEFNLHNSPELGQELPRDTDQSPALLDAL